MTDISTLAAELLLALQITLGQTPIDPPRAISMDMDTLKQRVCAQPSSRGCRIKAWYSPEGTVYIDENLDLENDIFSKGILVHELIHHVQRMKTGGPALDCKEWRRREHEAYAVQIFWLQKQGWHTGSLRGQFPFVRCD